ncbi:thiosulfate sulfurtransferase/rhodanese-like domain-containing protein 1 isoform X2 [Megalobrama amblycephala]|uniref:thiosulfate sulfurtransferase/rhodanese-like domain-containing protein 1 isoform X1 n=1 Tax=Megalobrama amblycephala TaxID=75352 RepID=UPI002014520D|nr:thiosulfate sulfurtransferase/rhodanese-like domain-containing protein 1 isoform X1 [Megalobrama amblycephala]XP_048042836.1 thiosulfate sulfurtransferase/rhodanese-like domain-containing protein 1 isoform X2 [Megalobrama amblycephala]
MNTLMRVSSGVRALVALLLLSVSAHSTEQCDNGAENCDKWTKTSNNQPLNTDIVVTYEQLKDMMSAGSVQLFDVREPDELEAGFIPGATNIPLGDVEQALRLSPDQFRERYGVTKPHRDDPDFVLYCQRGIRSLTALETARALGYTRARHYAGGFNEWLKQEDL